MTQPRCQGSGPPLCWPSRQGTAGKAHLMYCRPARVSPGSSSCCRCVSRARVGLPALDAAHRRSRRHACPAPALLHTARLPRSFLVFRCGISILHAARRAAMFRAVLRQWRRHRRCNRGGTQAAQPAAQRQANPAGQHAITLATVHLALGCDTVDRVECVPGDASCTSSTCRPRFGSALPRRPSFGG